MPLVKSPTMTPRKLAANRANSRQSTGPRTYAGRYRVVLNALKHGRYSQAFRSNLLKAQEDVALYDWIYARLRDSTQPVGKPQWQEVERLARETYCLLRRDPPKNGETARPRVEGAVWSTAWLPWRRGGLELDPSYVTKTGLSRLPFLSRMEITDDSTGLRLMFWVPRPRRRRAT